jgi:hypothetical protein
LPTNENYSNITAIVQGKNEKSQSNKVEKQRKTGRKEETIKNILQSGPRDYKVDRKNNSLEQKKAETSIQFTLMEFSSKKKDYTFIINKDISTIPMELRDDERFIRSYSHIGPTLRIASERLQTKESLIFDMCKLNPMNLLYVPYKLESNSDFVLKVIEQNKKCIKFAPEYLLTNQSFLKQLLESDWENGYFITGKYGYLLTLDFLNTLNPQTGFVKLYFDDPKKRSEVEHTPLTNITIKIIMNCIAGEISPSDSISDDVYFFKEIFDAAKMSKKIKKSSHTTFTFDSLVDMLLDYEDMNGNNGKSVLKIIIRSLDYLNKNNMVIEKKTLSSMETCINYNEENYILKSLNFSLNKLENFSLK